MKTFYLSFLLIMFTCFHSLSYSQQANHRNDHQQQPVFFTPKSHDPNFLKAAKFPDKSFYQRKSEWKHIIDTTWGPGAPYEEKLKVFNAYANVIHDRFSGFESLKLNWDSLYNHYLNQINDSTSRGAFAAIMNHFAYNLKEAHALAIDDLVFNTALNPGIPILLISSLLDIEHFGAVTTILSDSTTLIIRAAPNHPLNLQPGDIILGYEGIPWKDLVKELINAGIPFLGRTGGCKSADTYHNLMCAGMNWHLFSTIDILKYSTGDTLHLSLEPMLTLNLPPMSNNEQMPIKNIPFPNVVRNSNLPSSDVTYGILDNSNIGYIFLSNEKEYADNQFFEAVNHLKNTDALIIDMRMNHGGWTFLNQGLDILFNEFNKTIEDALRCNANSFSLCSSGNWFTYQINGKNPDYYDRPIAVLLGPSCFSMGDINAHRLRYHPMVKFFGASPHGSLGGDVSAVDIKDWWLHYPNTDMYHLNDPGKYLERSEFPIDFPVWFNKDDVAKGIDPIVEKAKEWINTLAYGHSLTINKSAFTGEDTLKAKAIIENPENHTLLVKLIIESIDSIKTDSVKMKPLNEGKGWQVTYDVDDLAENFYWLSVKVEDKTNDTFFTNRHMTRFTTVPLSLDSLDVKKMADYKYSIQPTIKNKGKTKNIEQTISVKLTTNPRVNFITPTTANSAALTPGQVKQLTAFKLSCDTTTFQSHFDLKFTVSSQGWPYWQLDTTIAVIPTSINDQLLPLTNSLDQNYPNPFNSQTTIQWQLVKACRASLSLYDIMGRKVAVLLDEYRPAGKYETLINASTLPKGIYFYQLKAGKFIQTKKMIVVK